VKANSALKQGQQAEIEFRYADNPSNRLKGRAGLPRLIVGEVIDNNNIRILINEAGQTKRINWNTVERSTAL
jgi:hypothetical protein